MEELVAELGAAFPSADLELTHEVGIKTGLSPERTGSRHG